MQTEQEKSVFENLLKNDGSEFCYAACRNRLLVAIGMAKAEGFIETYNVLVSLLKTLEDGQQQNAHD